MCRNPDLQGCVAARTTSLWLHSLQPFREANGLANVHSAAHILCASERSSFQARERGLEPTRRTSMQLTYMGNVYTRQTTVDAKPAVQLTYRRTSYDMRRAEAAAATEMLTYRGVAYQR